MLIFLNFYSVYTDGDIFYTPAEKPSAAKRLSDDDGVRPLEDSHVDVQMNAGSLIHVPCGSNEGMYSLYTSWSNSEIKYSTLPLKVHKCMYVRILGSVLHY